MEQNSQLSPEQSLRLINETLSSSRRAVISKSGRYFILWGVLLTIMALVIFFLWKAEGNSIWNLLWFAMPVIGYPLSALLSKNSEKIPSNLVSNLLSWTWSAFGAFALVTSFCALLFAPMNLTLVIILLFGFAESISGIILKNWPIIAAGFLTGIGGAVAAVELSNDCSQMLLFVIAGAILALTGVVVKCLK